MNPQTPPYFAYGANMDLRAMARRCPGAVPLGRGVLHGYEMLINSTGYATLTLSADNRVEGVLWELREEHHSILDDYEDHPSGGYDRCYREVVDGAGRTQMALVYIDHLRSQPSSPLPGYLESVIEGALEHGLSSEYIDWLRKLGEGR